MGQTANSPRGQPSPPASEPRRGPASAVPIPPMALEAAADAALLAAGVADPAERVKTAAALAASAEVRDAAAGLPSQRALLTALKAAGVAKLGTRHKVASALLARLEAPVSLSAGVTATASGGLGDDFWAQLSQASSEATAPLGLPLGLHQEAEHGPARPVLAVMGDERDISPGLAAPARVPGSRMPESARAANAAAERGPAPPAAAPAARLAAPCPIPRPAPPVAFDDRPAAERVAILRQCGRDAYRRGDLSGAEVFFSRAVALAPDDPDLHANLGACALGGAVPRPNLALQRLGLALALAPTHFKARMRAGRSMLLLGRLHEALHHFSAAAAAAPDGGGTAAAPAAVEGAGVAAAGAGVAACATSASAAAASILGTAPVSGTAPVPGAGPLLGHAPFQSAEEACASVRRLMGAVERARALASAGRCDEALVFARAVCEGCGCSALGSSLRVAALEGAGRLPEATHEAELMMAKAEQAMAEAAAAGAVGCEARSEYEAAVECFARVLCRAGDMRRAVRLLMPQIGRLQSEGGLGEGGADEAGTGGDAPPSSACSGATSHGAVGAQPAAPTDEDVGSRAGVGGGNGGNGGSGDSGGGLQRLLAGLREALRLKTEGNQLYAAGEYDGAIECYSAALAADTGGMVLPLLLGNRAQAQLRAGRPVRALQDVEAARRLDAGSAKLLLRRAACRMAMGQGEEAEADYRAALEIDSGCEAARRALAGLGIGEGQPGRASAGGSGEWAEGARRTPPPPAGGIDAYEELGLTPLATHSQV